MTSGNKTEDELQTSCNELSFELEDESLVDYRFLFFNYRFFHFFFFAESYFC